MMCTLSVKCHCYFALYLFEKFISNLHWRQTCMYIKCVFHFHPQSTGFWLIIPPVSETVSSTTAHPPKKWQITKAWNRSDKWCQCLELAVCVVFNFRQEVGSRQKEGLASVSLQNFVFHQFHRLRVISKFEHQDSSDACIQSKANKCFPTHTHNHVKHTEDLSGLQHIT